jgi:two-component system, cell cycle response regulator DivK
VVRTACQPALLALGVRPSHTTTTRRGLSAQPLSAEKRSLEYEVDLRSDRVVRFHQTRFDLQRQERGGPSLASGSKLTPSGKGNDLNRKATRVSKARLPALILVVDDSDDNRDMYAEFLRFFGYRVEEAVTGLEALAKARKLTPAAIVMDLSLPEMDGWEAIRRLKIDEKTKGIPIIVLTAHALTGVEKSARYAGGDVFLTKPCLPDNLAEAVARLLTGPI